MAKAKNVLQNNPGINALMHYAGGAKDRGINDILSQYSSGGMSLADALSGLVEGETGKYKDTYVDAKKALNAFKSKAPSPEGKHPLQYRQELEAYQNQLNQLQDKVRQTESQYFTHQNQAKGRRDQLFVDPLTGTQVATEQVQNNPMLSGMFGKGGLNDRLLAEEQDLASRGFSLQPEDHEAYGQASGNIARQFAGEEASIANALASRGLAAAPSGAATVEYSGLMGNKNERLAQAQRQIADDRMRMNLERLNSTRNFAMQGNQLGQAAIQDQFNRSLQGIQDFKGTMKDSAAAGQMLQGQENTAFSQHQETKGPGLGGILGGMAGGVLGSAAGSLGSAVGGNLGNSLFGGKVDPTNKKY